LPAGRGEERGEREAVVRRMLVSVMVREEREDQS
jgi:hypothetical protein